MARFTPSRAVTLFLLVITVFVYYGLGPDTRISDKLDSYGSWGGEVGAAAVALDFAPDGLVHGWDEAHKRLADPATPKKERRALEQLVKQHPIDLLIARAEQQWEGKMDRQSKTLPQAINQYRQRYGREPPKGFEKWWKFAQDNSVKIVDDYDQLHKDVEPWFAFSPETFRKRAKKVQEEASWSYHITLDPKNVSITGDRQFSPRGEQLRKLVEPLAPLLPLMEDGSPISFHVSDHDLGAWIPGADQMKFLYQAIADKRYVTEEELEPFEQKNGRGPVGGLLSACPEDSAGWKLGLTRKVSEFVPIPDKKTTFMYDPVTTYDYCNTPYLLSHHGSLSFDQAHDTILRPVFQLSKSARSADFLSTPMEAYVRTDHHLFHTFYKPWEQKDKTKLFWRGASTGDSYGTRDGYDWRRSHRPRLHLMAQNTTGSADVWVQRQGEWVKESWATRKLNEAYMDIGLVGRPHQCSNEEVCAEMTEEIHFAERVDATDSPRYKFAMDIDGNGWSSRLFRLLLSGSVILKSTVYPEFFTGNLIPWYHYVPVQVDYSDIYSIMAYFTGTPDGRSKGNDEAARRIAENGRKFALENWRWEDMQAYMFRILLEYARLGADDRDGWTISKEY